MFNLGTPEDTAILLWDRASLIPGPDLYYAPVDEMSHEDLRKALNYARVACNYAIHEGHPQEVLDVLMAQFDEIFVTLIPIDEQLKDFVLSGGFLPPTGTRQFYQRMARKALSES